MSLFRFLTDLPGSYQGPTRALEGPFGLLGLGEASLAARLCEDFAPVTLAREGTQLLLNSPETQAAADDFAALSEVSGVQVQRAGAGEGSRFDLNKLAFLAPGGVLSTYHLAQFVAHATGHSAEAQQAEEVLRAVRERCVPEIEDGNPARELAWSLWGRAPLLLAPTGEGVLIEAFQMLLARVGKVLSVPVEHEPLYLLTGAFEAHHERGDGRLALILGEEDAEMAMCRAVLETRIDEVLLVPYPLGHTDAEAGGYAGALGLWYFGAWVAAYLSEREGASCEDSPALKQVLGELVSAVPSDELN
ncbi:phosphosugar isomerase [Deinococcus ruber]|uniref:Phosphosugar isomerase n=1 Tax=Deinococcus ruber TaxID=1848197 RepID=A0A918BVW8_9DEIO|nr:phosphosugar isomerase [Deinococcus ruber]GGQ95016.1 phosphosugar isomerase [Deinococcus ruber]